jgi:F-type H+-transporting ATPase subunit a
METSPLAPSALFHLGPVPIAPAVVTTWGLMAALTLVCWLGTRRLALEPGPLQATLEILVTTLASQIAEIMRRDAAPFLPLIGTLFVFLATANLSAVVPGAAAPTAHIETPAALALVVFCSVHAFGIRARGLGGYLRGYLRPNPLLLPLNVLSELTRTFSLMVRLFGNIMSHEFVIGIVLSLAGLLVPVPFMALAILIGLIQAYIFTVLAAVFIAAGLGAIER